MAAKFENDWQALLAPEFEKAYYTGLRAFLANEYRTKAIYPKAEAIFNALHFTAYQDIKAVIIGQDPYHGEGRHTAYVFPLIRVWIFRRRW